MHGGRCADRLAARGDTVMAQTQRTDGGAPTQESLRDVPIARLNAHLFPPPQTERAQYRRYQLKPIEIEGADPKEILGRASDCAGLFVVSAKLPAAVIAQLRYCRVIARLGNGTDRIDVEAATRQGILVTNVPYFCYQEMADHAMAMLLSLARRIPQAARDMAAGRFVEARIAGQQLARLTGRTLGLIGFGASARAMAARARPFGLRVIATRRTMHGRQAEAEALGVSLVDLDTLLAESDFISLHLPLTSVTYHMLDAQAIAKMKSGAIVINTSRGALIDETALADALRTGHLAGAGLDTFESIEIFASDQRPPRHALLELDNVIATPHVSGLSVQALEEVYQIGVENLVLVLAGCWPSSENIVNPDVVPRVPLKPYDPARLEAWMAP